VSMAGLVAHELAHLYNRMYNHRTRTGSESRLGTALWGTEGSADLVRYETIRRAGALPLAGNYDWLNPGTGAYASFFARLAQPGTGEFSRGYGGSMGFLRRLVAQRVADGESVDQAMREVVRGAIEGWYGKDLLGSTRPGLAARMAERFSGWKPEDAMLEWTLAHAADDLTPSARHQDAAFQRISAIPSGYDALAWRPDLEIEGGAGGTYTVERRWGGTGYSYLRDTGAGIRFRAAADTPGVRWMLMRIR
ncbi:MAG TPA: hypothetical protein VFQ45_22065, partial [Longimicrobium sp.]|nr:hypothetical protein [Longimicrobium sp.]